MRQTMPARDASDKVFVVRYPLFVVRIGDVTENGQRTTNNGDVRGSSSSDHPDRLIRQPGQNIRDVRIAEVAYQHVAHDVPEVDAVGEIASAHEVLRAQSRPGAVDAAANAATGDEPRRRVAVVGAAAAVVCRGATELAHGDHR